MICKRSQDQVGFTLVELLVVMLILGLLAAVVIPLLLSQTRKAGDARAKVDVRSAQSGIETYRTDNAGSYAGATPAALANIEATLSGDVPPTTSKNTLTVSGSGGAGAPDASSYRVSVANADTGNTFWIDRAPSGLELFGCTTAGTAGCPKGGNWGN